MTNLTGQSPYQKTGRKTKRPPKLSSSQKIRDSANGKECTADWCGCNGSTETTVLCHIRKFGISGKNMKPPDFIAFYGCRRAHDIFDARSNEDIWNWESVCRAMILTQIQLNKDELLYAA